MAEPTLRAWVFFGPNVGTADVQATVWFTCVDVAADFRNGVQVSIPFDPSAELVDIAADVKAFVIAMSVDLNDPEEERNVTVWQQGSTFNPSTGAAWLSSVVEPANILMQSFV